MVQEFKEFITRGNLITLATGFIMGVVFQAVVSSLVQDVIMPFIAIPFGQPNFAELTWVINDAEILWGSFVTALVVFILTALAVFLFIVKPYNAFERSREEEEETESEDTGPSEIDLLIEIRELLKEQRL